MSDEYIPGVYENTSDVVLDCRLETGGLVTSVTVSDCRLGIVGLVISDVVSDCRLGIVGLVISDVVSDCRLEIIGLVFLLLLFLLFLSGRNIQTIRMTRTRATTTNRVVYINSFDLIT